MKKSNFTVITSISLLIREIIVSIFLKNIIINLFLLLPLVYFSIKYSHNTLLGAIVAIFATINIEETYKSVEKEKFWQKIRYFYYILYFEQLRFIIERIEEIKSKNVTPKEGGQSVEGGNENKNEMKLLAESKSSGCIHLTNEDKQTRKYNLIPNDMDNEINKVITDLTCYKDSESNFSLKGLEEYFNRLLNNAIENIEKYATRRDVFDKILEAKEFIILLKQNPNKVGLLISFLEISKELFSLVKIELLLNKYSCIRIGKNLFIEGAYEPGKFQSREYTLIDFCKETSYKFQRWCCNNIC